MRQFFTILFTICILSMYAQTEADSTYVYGYLRWSPSMTKYIAKLEIGPGKELEDITDDKGVKLKFASFLNALNYMASQKWEVFEISPRNPENSTFILEQFAIIRKKMSIAEAMPYIAPKE